MSRSLPQGRERRGQGKKLTDAAHWLAQPRAGDAGDQDEDDEFVEDLRRMGVPDAELAKMEQAADDGDDFEIWPENVPAFELFIAAMTQMRVNDFTGVPTGLDYGGLQATARLRRVKLTTPLFDDIQVIELAYVKARRKRAAEEAS